MRLDIGRWFGGASREHVARVTEHGMAAPALHDLGRGKRLGGSTGAYLHRLDDGTRLVRKEGASSGHLAEEVAANDVYRALDVPVPAQVARHRANGSAIDAFSAFVDGRPLAKLARAEREGAVAQLRENFAVDALLANWDATLNDNVRVTRTGTAVRVDNGGALRYRAQGGRKDAEFGARVVELETMRSRKHASVYTGMTDAEVATQIRSSIVPRREVILAAAPEAVRDVLSRRIEYMARWADGVPA